MALSRHMTRMTFGLPFAALLAFPAAARATDLGVRLEPGLAVPLAAPQAGRFTAGGVVSAKGFIGLNRYLEAQAGFSFVGVGTATGTIPTTMGTAWSDSLGLRLKRPHDLGVGRGAFSAASPWVDLDGLYVRTGGLDRFGLTLGAGVSFPLVPKRTMWLGPFVRYMQIVEGSKPELLDGDARLLFIGVNFELGTSPLRAAHVAAAAAGPCPACAPVMLTQPDRDHDGTFDATDNCPDVAGRYANHGCPVYKKVIVKPDRIELTEKILFAYDKADIESESFPLLDEVVQALEDNKGFNVQVEGHTDSRGTEAYNQTLSEQRAESVVAYLRNHGVPAERLSYKGFGETEATDSNKTIEGREHNRRVDFVVQFKIIDRSAK